MIEISDVGHSSPKTLYIRSVIGCRKIIADRDNYLAIWNLLQTFPYMILFYKMGILIHQKSNPKFFRAVSTLTLAAKHSS